MKTKNEFECAFVELLDNALNILSPAAFKGLLDSISMIVSNYED